MLDKFDGDGTVFHGLLNSDLPPSEKSNFRMRQEAQLLVLAGQDTTAYTLSSLTYQLLANPHILRKLKKELAEAIPDPNAPVTSTQLEQLPYLAAIVEEGIRLHPGALVRQTRIAPEQSMFYKDTETGKQWVIPPGTPVSMDARNCNLNPKYFKDPHKFIPERWIENPRLDRYNISFSKGTRICLGLNLAYSELFMIVASIFRRYDLYDGTGKQTTPTLALYDTTWERDASVHYDYLVPFAAKGSKGIQVQVRNAAEH
jgi:cytochrome P450